MNGRWLARAAVSGGLALCLAACAATLSPSRSLEVVIVGSDTMLPLNRHLATVYMQTHPGAVIRVEGGGTGIGTKALIEGWATLCAASRNLSPDEVEALYAATGTLGLRTMVALDAIAVYLHPDNPIGNLTSDQLAAIFTGDIRSWQEVGGIRSAILPVIRPPTSGTHRFFRNHVLAGRPYADHALTVQRTSDVIDEVARLPAAIGYGGLAYTGAVRHCAVDGVTPDEASVRDGSYPLSRYLYLVAAQPPEGPARDFVTWVTGEKGQAAVATVGLIPLWPSS